ncbi:MAG: hypothetical protein NT069_19700 [Planctomycetota bacterium]|nr:hypothetical protein [Planctomycetota bacterium]
MIRWIAIALLLGGGLAAYWPWTAQPESKEHAAAEPDEPAAGATESDAEPATPRSPGRQRRRVPRDRPESDLPTRDLVLRGHAEDDNPTPEDLILETLDRELAVNFEAKPLREILTELAKTAGINLYLEESPRNTEEEQSAEADPTAKPMTSALDSTVTVHETEIRFETLLERLIEPVGLAWAIRHDALWIREKSQVDRLVESRSYDVATLIAAGHKPHELVKALIGAVSSPQEGPQGIAFTGGVIIAFRNQPQQRIIAKILSELDEIAEAAEEGDKHRTAPQAGVPRKPFTVQPVKFARVADEKPKVPQDVQILEALDERHDVEFHDQTLAECLTALEKMAEIPILVDLNQFTGTDRAGAFGKQPRVTLKNARLESILGTLLEPRGLGWIIQHETLRIVDVNFAYIVERSKTYDVSNLLDGGHDPLELVDAIRDLMAYHWGSYTHGSFDGSVEIAEDALVVRLSHRGHWELAQILAELDQIVEDSDTAGETRPLSFTWESYPVPPESTEALAKTLPEIVAPRSWKQNAQRLSDRAEAELRAVPGLLLIRQTKTNHRELRRLLVTE